MRTTQKLMLAAFAAMLLLALIAGSAAALRSIESSTTRIESLARELTFEDGSGHNIICEVGTTLSLENRSSQKRAGARIGAASFRFLGEERCTGGHARVVGGPFIVRYNSFAGTLPRGITSENLTVERVVFLLEVAGFFLCQITFELSYNAIFETVRAEIYIELRGEEPGEEFRQANVTRRALAFCPAANHIKGRFAATGTAPTIRLV